MEIIAPSNLSSNCYSRVVAAVSTLVVTCCYNSGYLLLVPLLPAVITLVVICCFNPGSYLVLTLVVTFY